MRSLRSRLPAALLSAALVLAPALAVTACRGAEASAPQATPPDPTSRPAPPAASKASWKEVDRLLGEQKLAEAAKLVEQLEAAARGRGDDRDLARALVRQTQIGLALGGYETAVEALAAKAWPESPRPRAEVELYYAHAIAGYLDAYRWEIQRRERIVSGEKLDLKLWTVDQLAAEADRAFARVWARRDTLSELATADLELLSPNDYPAGIRPTARDAVAYLWAERLADSSQWTPEQLEERWKLDLGALAAGEGIEPTPERLGDAALHPLARAAALLGDLERWHRGRGETGAALEARIVRLEHLHGAVAVDDDRARLRDVLERSLAEFPREPWRAMGLARLAEMWRQSPRPDALVRARGFALDGERAFPGSPGATACRSVREQIEAPSYSLQSMTVDAARRRSVLVDHRNLERLHLRAYRLPAEPFASRPVEWRGWSQERIRGVLGREPAAAWALDLPATPDFRDHRTYATPPLDQAGRYLIVASARPGFGAARNHLEAVELELSDLVVLRDPQFGADPSTTVVRAVSGRDGRPLAGAEAALYRFQWEQRPELVERTTTGADGLARFTRLERSGAGSIAVVVRHGGQESVWTQGWWGGHPHRGNEPGTGALVFTDRAIYRPGQRVLWKVLVWTGERERGRIEGAASHALTVDLVDPNGEAVATVQAETNRFGTAAGSFEVPTGRLLGNWTVRTSAQGAAGIAVEEYKRPSFEVTIAEPESELRLNRPAELGGEARYYFGLPVTSGRVAWRVVRESVWRPWCWCGFWRPPAPPRTIAAGTAELDGDGRFRVRFTPEADERERADGLSFRFTLSAEVTDDGGETRDGSRSVALGWVGVELGLDGDPFLVGPGSERTWTLRRRDLDGTARPGASTWRLVELAQPDAAPLPAEVAESLDPERPATPGDSLRPRWAGAPANAELVAGWAVRRELASGRLDHGEDGAAAWTLPQLARGAYRLELETRDAHGETARLVRPFVIADAGGTALAAPLELAFERPSVPAGGTARLFVHSGIPGQTIALDVTRGARVLERRTLTAGRDAAWIDFPVGLDDRGGFGVRATIVADHQVVSRQTAVAVPWDDRGLTLDFTTFRDRLEPGARETFRVTVRDAGGRAVEAGAAELLASMYDRSLDYFRAHTIPSVAALWPVWFAPPPLAASLGQQGAVWREGEDWWDWTGFPHFAADAFVGLSPYGIGGPGYGISRQLAKGAVAMDAAMAPAPASAAPQEMEATVASNEARAEGDAAALGLPASRADAAPPAAPVALRTDFSETAFWQPTLLTGADGSAAIEFQVPDSVTSWKLWVQAVTRDLASGSIEREVDTVKELMVRPYLPRFLREGDAAELRVVVNNAGETKLAGTVELAILDPETEQDLTAQFGLAPAAARRDFAVEAGKGADVVFAVTAPRRLGPVAFRAVARAGNRSDGELRPLPVLPARVRLAQSRFAVLSDRDRRELEFADMRKDDPTRIDEQLVVTVDGQLFYGLLDALPYLVNYPYECTEQTLNRFVSTGILSSLFAKYPAVEKMAAGMAERETRYERFDAADPNRRMALEETPWLQASRGRDTADGDPELLRVLDPKIAKAQRDEALAKLAKAQLPSGAFPWFPGGPPSPFMTVYLLHGFAKAAEFGVDLPRDMVQRGWQYLAREAERGWIEEAMADDCCWEVLTFLNYVASSYPDPSWMGDAFPERLRRKVLDFSFRHWKEHAPQSKLQLALTLQRMKRADDARLVLDSVMDSSSTDRDLGTFWQPEDRAWLWYRDSIETHAWAIRALSEISPGDRRLPGMVQWIFLQKKLNHWKSTRATAEVVYSVAHYLDRGGTLAAREEARVTVGDLARTFVFEPDRYTGKKNQLVIEGAELDPATDSVVVVEKETPGLLFASATWHFSTEELPAEARGDLFSVERSYFKRVRSGKEATLVPLAEGARLEVGDEVEVRLSIRAKAAAEYVHLRDPRPAGLEPDRAESGWKWELGPAWYEETRDSGTNFFFENLPAGEYPLRYRLRAATAGTFRAAPAQLQSMYAPEFTAYSAGGKLVIAAAGK